MAYQETPRTAVSGVEGKASKQNGGVGQFTRVVVDIAPCADGEIVFEDRTSGGVVPEAFVNATEKGVRASLSEGPLGHPVVGITVVLVDGKMHAKDSSDHAFQRGVRSGERSVGATRHRAAGTGDDSRHRHPAYNVGDVVGDVQRRHGRVVSIDDNGTHTDVAALAPLAALAG